MITHPSNSKFELHRIRVTPGVFSLVEANPLRELSINHCLDRFANMDFGFISDDDKLANKRAIVNHGMVMGSYILDDDKKIWIIRNYGEMATTILLPEEY